jgi:hypothetical protein
LRWVLAAELVSRAAWFAGRTKSWEMRVVGVYDTQGYALGSFQDRLVEERRGFVASIDCAVGCRPM